MIELRFVRGQRDKTGSLGTDMISTVDVQETRKQKDAIARQELKRQREEKKKVALEEKERQCMSQMKAAEMLLQEESDVEDSSVIMEVKRKRQYNTKDISNVALDSIRYHTGLRETAEIALQLGLMLV